ncbi:MAG: hypothetical protein WCC60_04755 [Ilumatobacteraceae bacterium]
MRLPEGAARFVRRGGVDACCAARPGQRRRRCFAVAVTLLLVGACSDDTAAPAGSGVVSDQGSSSRPDDTSDAATDGGDLPILDQIDEAVAALEAELGAPQQYFEINATARLVNLFVALNNATVAQGWLYLDGTLTSSEGQQANGGTFTAGAAEFDPAVILSKVLTELPDITIESFYINGDGQGNVLYGVLATSAKGGGLDVVLGADGSVKSVDPVT